MVPGLMEAKMSSSDADSKNFLDTHGEILKNLKKAFCEPGNINGLLSFCKYVVYPVALKGTINRPEEYGGDASFDDDNEHSFANEEIIPGDLKAAVEKYCKYCNRFLDPVRKSFRGS